MAAGVLAKSGYFMGDQLIPADEANPKGYFEDMEVNSINEEILASAIPVKPSGFLGKHFFHRRPVHYQRWLTPLPAGSALLPRDDIPARIQTLIARQPYCFKDPRFCYTLDVWRPYLAQVEYVCVFRDPLATIASLVKEARRDSTLRGVTFRFDKADALKVWCSMYEHVLRRTDRENKHWLFINYDQFIDGSAFPRLASFLGARIDGGFIDPRYQRSGRSGSLPDNAAAIFATLCELSRL
jgi:hypothetical protein